MIAFAPPTESNVVNKSLPILKLKKLVRVFAFCMPADAHELDKAQPFGLVEIKRVVRALRCFEVFEVPLDGLFYVVARKHGAG